MSCHFYLSIYPIKHGLSFPIATQQNAPHWGAKLQCTQKNVPINSPPLKSMAHNPCMIGSTRSNSQYSLVHPCFNASQSFPPACPPPNALYPVRRDSNPTDTVKIKMKTKKSKLVPHRSPPYRVRRTLLWQNQFELYQFECTEHLLHFNRYNHWSVG